MEIDTRDTAGAEAQTLAAMRAASPSSSKAHSRMADGADGQISCAALRPQAHWVLVLRTDDTKLARETKAGTILQLCLYSDLMREAQGVAPEFMYVVPPWTDFKPQQYRFTDYAAYFRKAKRGLRQALDGQARPPIPSRRHIAKYANGGSNVISVAATMTTSASLRGSPGFRSTN